GYYINAAQWAEQFKCSLIWSPTYTAFYGTVLLFCSNLWLATLVHRIIIVFAVSVLVLAFFRRLLPPGIAWLAAAWWCILPINFNTLYEVHLFAVLPILVCWLLLLDNRGPWTRGIALGVLGMSVVLVRNEMSIAFLLIAGLCWWWERLSK